MVEKNKVLIIGAPKSGKLTLTKKLFGTVPDIASEEPHSGLIHQVTLKTKYYTKPIDIWIDEFVDSYDNDGDAEEEKAAVAKINEPKSSFQLLQDWFTEFNSPDYKEIRDVISGIILCLDISNSVGYNIEQIEKVAQWLVKTKETLQKDEKDNIAVEVGSKNQEPTNKEAENDNSQNAEGDEGNNNDNNFNDLNDYNTQIWNGFITVAAIRKQPGSKSELDPSHLEEIFWDNDLDFCVYTESSTINDTQTNQYGEKSGLPKIKEIIDCFEWNNIRVVSSNENGKNNNTNFRKKEELLQELAEPLVKTEDKESSEKLDDKHTELEHLIRKIKIAKENASNIDDQQAKEKFAQDFVNDLIDYL